MWTALTPWAAIVPISRNNCFGSNDFRSDFARLVCRLARIQVLHIVWEGVIYSYWFDGKKIHQHLDSP